MTEAQTIEDESVPSPFPPEVTHSHPNEMPAEAFHVVDVVCARCRTEQSFTVPNTHNGSKIKWACRACEFDNYTEGPEAVDVVAPPGGITVLCGHCSVPQTTSSTRFTCSNCGTLNQLISSAEVASGSEQSSVG